jgi:hypothetical protein
LAVVGRLLDRTYTIQFEGGNTWSLSRREAHEIDQFVAELQTLAE